jgi:hypothetical protein
VPSLSSAAELIDDHIDAVATNGVHCGTRSALVAAMSYFLELGTEMELHGPEHNADLTEDQVDALWTQARQDSDLLALFVPLLIARGAPNGTGEE